MITNILNTLNNAWIELLGCPDCWAGIIAIVTLIAIWVAYRKSQRTIIVHKSGIGNVQVSISALVHLVKEACMRVGIQHCSNVHFQKNGSKYDLDLTVKTTVDQNLTDLLSSLTHFMHGALGRILGPDYVGKINLTVVGFKGDMKNIPIPTISDLENQSEEFKLLSKKDGSA
jgi:hypothetical protein